MRGLNSCPFRFHDEHHFIDPLSGGRRTFLLVGRRQIDNHEAVLGFNSVELAQCANRRVGSATIVSPMTWTHDREIFGL